MEQVENTTPDNLRALADAIESGRRTCDRCKWWVVWSKPMKTGLCSRRAEYPTHSAATSIQYCPETNHDFGCGLWSKKEEQ